MTSSFFSTNFLRGILLIPLLASYVAAQTLNYQDGFVVTSKNDTIIGKISNSHKTSFSFIYFLYPTGTDTILQASALNAYEIGNNEYITVPLPHATKDDTISLFAKVLVDGYASLYVTKIKTDFLSSGSTAYLCRKYDESQFYPAGKIRSLANFFKDYPTLHTELKDHHHLYTNTEETKIQLFNHYNAWKRHIIDSLAGKSTIQESNNQLDKKLLEVTMADSVTLSSTAKLVFDHIVSKLSKEPHAKLILEFVPSKGNDIAISQVMKAVLYHLNPYAARIEASILSSATVSEGKGYLLYYYFR